MTLNATNPARAGLAIVLAAGEGTRMKSAVPKVLHKVAGRSMLANALASVAAAGVGRVAVVVGPGRDDVAAEARAAAPGAEVFVQTERLGTAHAVLAARAALGAGADDLIVVFADTPLIEPATFLALRRALADGAAVAALGFVARDPAGYGRLLTKGDELLAIREHKDASEAERATTLCNAGLMALDGRLALSILDSVRPNNAQKEFYLTDAVEIARARGLATRVVTAPEEEVMGVNDRVQLAAAEAVAQRRLREKAMRDGVTMIAPETVFLCHDTTIGRDTVIEPNVFFGPGVTIGEGAVVKAFSHFEGARVAGGASVGPFSRLRPGADIETGVKIGNFVEIKSARIGEGSAVSHLSYVGDSVVGVGANIGAGTITCNYDGFDKARTEIGDGAFIGSNSALVAPVRIGAGAYVGSGSVITKDVEPDALAVGRGRQFEKAGWAAALRKSREGKTKKRV
jgi:bifunctional UDP-N-acetylglucosamine pyrophosphorylase/glucosamine-1-phosphate N-acetyltransferase